MGGHQQYRFSAPLDCLELLVAEWSSLSDNPQQRIDDRIPGDHNGSVFDVFAQQIFSAIRCGSEMKRRQPRDQAAVYFFWVGEYMSPVRRPASRWATGMCS